MAGAMGAHDTRTWVNQQAFDSKEARVAQAKAAAVKSPMVLLVGCAATTAEPHIWILSQAGERTLSPTAGITTAEKRDLQNRPLGRDTYQLLGVADFVDADTAQRIGVRSRILSRPRMNTTAMLASGHKVAVKGLYIDARPPRINLTSVADLGGTCATAPAVQIRTLENGAYTAAQQQRGAAIYNRECSTCHGETLKGGEGSPALVGATFKASYNGRTVADLFSKIRETMPAPPEQPGKLTPQENADVVAHILSVNGFPAGDVELSSTVEQLKRLRITATP